LSKGDGRRGARVIFRRLQSVLVAAMLTAIAVPAVAAGPFDFENSPGRLPKTVVPSEYRMLLVLDPVTMAFRGAETVSIDVRRATNRIAFDAHDLLIIEARFDGTRVTDVKSDNEQQLTTLTLPQPVVGHHTLTLTWAGKIGDAAAGIFARDYRKADGKTGRVFSTQFDPTEARRMFPGWDEPAFRATYQLSVTLPATWTAVSNMPVASRSVRGDVATTAFLTTPKMPAYLLELTAGDLTSIDGTGPDGVKQSVWSVHGDAAGGRYTLDSAEQILTFYDDYFGVAYPLPKLDHIAIPGGFGGATETWGAIAYNENIVIQHGTASLAEQQQAYTVVGHELAHQWMGDLVAMGWWDDGWLNEGVASLLAAKAADHFYPGWHWWQGQAAAKQSAMNADARSGAHALQLPVADEFQADAAFDTEITYDKGQAFLRMLEAYLGEDTFRNGVRAYIKTHAYSNGTSADLWYALNAASKKDVAAFARGWSEQPGFPLVSVTAACNAGGNRTVTLAQTRFFVDGTTDPARQLWSVPVGLASGSAAPSYVLLTGSQQGGIPAGRCSEPLRANAGGVGYYRVAYDALTLEANRKAFGTFADDDKIAMLYDQWALARVGQSPLGSYLGLVNAVGDDRNAAVWLPIVGSLTALEGYTRATPLHAATANYARDLITPIARSLGWDPRTDDSSAVVELRRSAIGLLAACADPGTLAEARRRFDRSLTSPASLTPEMRLLVIGIVATNADAPTFNRLHALIRTTKDALLAAQYRGALMHVRDPQLAQRALQIAFSSEVSAQEEAVRFGYVATAADWNPRLAWAAFQAHADAITRGFTPTGMATAVPGIFHDAAPPEQIESWLKAHLPAQAAPAIAAGMSRARTDAAARTRLRESLQTYLSTKT
jgi:aminopeptidase N